MYIIYTYEIHQVNIEKGRLSKPPFFGIDLFLPGETKNLRQKKSSLFRLLSKLGWNMGLEPTTLGTTNRCSNQLS